VPSVTGAVPILTPRTPARSIEELLAGATERRRFGTTDSKSGAAFEHVMIDGEPHVVKYLHVDTDWISRAAGDVRSHPLRVWESGVLDALPDCVDTGVVGVAEGLGRNGWGAALLMRDLSPWLVPAGDERVSLEQHLRFLDHMAAVAARFWNWTDTVGLLPYAHRWLWFGVDMLAVEEGRGWQDHVPPIAAKGWRRFAERAPSEVAIAVDDIRHDPFPFIDALRATPSTFLHGDWKMGNLGSHPNGRTILLDFAAPGQGPITHDLGWYLALNRARLPQPKEEAIEAFRDALERRGVATDAWWDVQLPLALLGTLVQFGWEKALGSDDELAWWCDRAREGLRLL
jgi:hypothetical protein